MFPSKNISPKNRPPQTIYDTILFFKTLNIPPVKNKFYFLFLDIRKIFQLVHLESIKLKSSDGNHLRILLNQPTYFLL